MAPTTEVLEHLMGLGIVGAAAAVQDRSFRLSVSAVGVTDRSLRTPMTANHRFRIASISKTFIAAVLLQLLQEGRVELEQPIARWLPGKPFADRVTLRHLLLQTGGLPIYSTYRIEDIPPPEMPFDRMAFIERAFAETPPRGPGGPWEYANVGSRIVGLVIEELTGSSLADQIRRRLLDPLELARTLPSGWEGPLPEDLARGYYFADDGGEPVDVTARVPRAWLWSGGDMLSTVGDLAIWMRALFTGKVLTAAWTRRLIEDLEAGSFPGSCMSHHGLGIMVFRNGGRRVYGYRGSTPGYVGIAGWSPEPDRAIAVQTNSFSPDTDSPLRSGVEDTLFALLG